ncbi:MAG TPA: DUF1839 family protein [Usitatibacter sp.]|nr:DUF1839 family protein [Usitatibacter sp.]
MCWPSADSPRPAIAALDPATYQRHALHGEGRTWAETNCYTDLLIELAHGFGHEPLAMLPFTLAIDFEGDQWTFFKPPHAELDELYGMDVQELAIWRPLVDHVVEQVAAGHPVLVELDAWYLPDTAGTSYRTQHSKTTVGVNMIDVPGRRMGYFHNAGYYALEGEDFEQAFLLGGIPHDRVLPPYVEFVKWRPGFRAPRGRELVEASLPLLRRHLAHAPRENPFPKFRARFAQDLAWLMQADIGRFHAYSFATLRQYGACFELSETYLRWLGDHGVDGVAAPAAALKEISETAKAFQFQLARSMARKRPLDLAPIDAMGAAWSRAMDPLRDRFA